MPEKNIPFSSLILFASLGLIIYIFLSSSFSFKDKLFNNLFPTRFSKAQESLSINIKNPNDAVILPAGNRIFIDTSVPENVQISKVEFYINNDLTCMVKHKSYTCIWEIPQGAGSRYEIVAKAYDNTGKSAEDSITITAR